MDRRRAAALAGVPLLSGFFSKDEVLHAVLVASPAAGVALAIAAAFTAFYITRATVLTFFGEYRGSHHPHEAGVVMWAPLVALAVPAALLGLAGGRIAEALGGHEEALSIPVAALSATIALVGIALGWALYRRGPSADNALAARLGPVWRASRAAYGADAFAYRFVVSPVLAFSRGVYAVFDRLIFDGAAEGLGALSRGTGRAFSRLQTGDGQWYAALMGAGVVALIALSTSPGAVQTILGWFGR